MPTPAWPLPDARRPRGVVAAALVLGATLFSAVLAEGLVRSLVRRDADGQEWMRDVRLRPYRLPLAQIRATLAALAGPEAFLTYDPEVGWKPRPGARSRDGLRRVDGAGIRTDVETAPAAASHVLRIALFGDSFTFGDEVGQDHTWGAALRETLATRGTPAEVLNFGVNAYGIDQAYLRWRTAGRLYQPAVVVLGFQAEDVLRNLNVFRPFYFMNSEVPLSKPRFVARDGVLTTVNVPTIPPERLPAVLAAIDDEPLLAYERYFAAHASHWWMQSKAAALVATALAGTRSNPWVLTDEAHDLAARIVAAFAADVHAAGAAFVIVHLPRREDFTTMRSGAPLWYADLLRTLDARHAVVHPEATIAHPDDTMFAPHGHYAPALNRMIGATLADPVLRAAERR